MMVLLARALDGKHVKTQASSNQGSNFFNYKQFHSINPMASWDAKLKSTFIDVNQPGCWSDSEVYEAFSFQNTLLHVK